VNTAVDARTPGVSITSGHAGSVRDWLGAIRVAPSYR
jgi:hypothetical protein